MRYFSHDKPHTKVPLSQISTMPPFQSVLAKHWDTTANCQVELEIIS